MSSSGSSSSRQYYKVGVLVFDGADILDFAGPIEILTHVSHNRNPDQPDRVFEIRLIARSPTIRAAGSLTVAADILLDYAIAQIADFDILVVPGGPPAVLQPLIETKAPELDLVRAFAALASQSAQKPRIIFSVCTGAFLLGAAGTLSGVTVTTHHRALDMLRDVCSRAIGKDAPPATVVHQRYVDGGYLEGDSVRVITAGGISSGLDATFYLVSRLIHPDMASFVARLMEYDWSELKQ